MTLSRLPNNPESEKFGQQLNRAKPISCQWDGFQVSGFEGDCLYSAAVANGLSSTTHHKGQSLALDWDIAPLVWVKIGAQFQLRDSASLQISPKAQFFTYHPSHPDGPSPAARALAAAPFGKRSKSPKVSQNLEDAIAQREGISAHTKQSAITIDVLVIGGGRAGTEAAVGAAKEEKSVLVCEKSGYIGGSKNLHPVAHPEFDQLRASGQVRLWKHARATALTGSTVTIFRSHNQIDEPLEEITVEAKEIVLATGRQNLVPTFSGNRHSGLISFQNCIRFLRDYALFPSGNFCTYGAENLLLDLVLEAAKFDRSARSVLDFRAQPACLQIDYLKAFGVTTRTAAQVRQVEKQAEQISIHTHAALMEGTAPSQDTFDSMIFSGGWQPNLDLWVQAGGRIIWSDQQQCLVSSGCLKNIRLVGSVSAPSMPESDTEDNSAVAIPCSTNPTSSGFTYFDHGSSQKIHLGKNDSALFSLALPLNRNTQSSGNKKIHESVVELAIAVRTGEMPAQAIPAIIEERYFKLPDTSEKCDVYQDRSETDYFESFYREKFGKSANTLKIESCEGALLRGALLFEQGKMPALGKEVGIVLESAGGNAKCLLSTKLKDTQICVAHVSGQQILCRLTPLK